MVDRIQKALDKLSDKERFRVQQVLLNLQLGVFGGDIKKLKGYEDVYRIRVGKMRVIYRIVCGKVVLLTVDRRGDTTYNF